MSIIQLPDALSNKIAAGEVVERPASVVKELIENSIDAGSTTIKIEVTEAGLMHIKVTDNGAGMDENDVNKAFLRHATSKIKNEVDLFHVLTLGFRGEALASIASVSKLTIKTSRGDSAGTTLYLEGGFVKKKSKSDARKGTEITVDELFYNTPARLKYMKTIHTELGHITDIIYRMALAHPKIRFELEHNQKLLFKTSGDGDILHVIAKIYGINVVRKMLPIQAKTLDFRITGYVCKPEVTRASRNYISIIINGRFIKNVALNQAILRAYHTLLPIGRSPLTVLKIEMDPILLDVNVHPTKLEVRFSKEKELIELLENTIKHTFNKTHLIPEMSKENKNSVTKEHDNEQSSFHLEPKLTSPIYKNETINPLEQQFYSDIEENSRYNDEILLKENYYTQEADLNSMELTPDLVKEERIPNLYPIGQLQGTYIMAQNENGLYMIDQHAAQERIKYEYFKKKLGQTNAEVQELLIPLTFEFTSKEMSLIEINETELNDVGIFLERFGEQAYIIRSHPTWFPKNNEAGIIREMVDLILDEKRIDIEKMREEVSIMMSCKGSIKANHYLTHEDMTVLLNDLRMSTDPFTCPHGRPIIVHFSTYELEKMFKRVM